VLEAAGININVVMERCMALGLCAFFCVKGA